MYIHERIGVNAVRSDAAAQTGSGAWNCGAACWGVRTPSGAALVAVGGDISDCARMGVFEARPPDPIGTNGCQRLGIRIRWKGRIFTPGDLISDVCGPAAASV